jgi:peptidoglycan lytic transglycosylase
MREERIGITSLFLLFLILIAALSGCASRHQAPSAFQPSYPLGFVERGQASWYGPGFHGHRTANGERYDMYQLTAAHRTLPLGSIAEVRSLTTGRQITVRINDRGPFARGRILDLSFAGAQAIGMIGRGTDDVELRVLRYPAKGDDLGLLLVQIGSFADPANARLILERLKARYPGSKAMAVDLPGGRRYRVYAGPFRTEPAAEQAAAELRTSLDIDPFIIRDDRLPASGENP